MRCAYSAASRGIRRKTDPPTAVIVSDLRTSRRAISITYAPKFPFVAPVAVAAQHPDPRLGHARRLDRAVAVVVGNHLATAGESDVSAIFLLAVTLERESVAFKLIAEFVIISDARQAAASPELSVVATQKIILAIELPPRQVHVHSAHAVVIVSGHALELGEVSPCVAADRIHQVAADRTGGVRQTVGKERGFRIEQEPCRLAGTGSNNESSCVQSPLFLRRLVDV